ncbi:hypothetical protein CAOG_02957 [Capsaspora owczarzaki ATCC 30864]|uniref:Oxysterol-binding protein n=1 Tax=Capsaspora owczarzaki (strain ATCC 30864) TaxID=595528 RepID=A0A0D2X240_CAPO3|nr:hypothetical protein CAOG_02957 [Capsaspora owczarzaki ATCC 30864]KJE91894.1 hypothetical protein CAOG_002957 [Capsaspora owczarzaki ATCC 30864]|eukprot:XP_004363796.1 hypothetical protein CAOG_02957 [Capsaspora owczarzaki ATCC 30864]
MANYRSQSGWFDIQFVQESVNLSHERQPKQGGLKFTDLEYLQLQRNGAWEVLSQWGNSILEGKEIVNLEFPIEFFEPRTVLERLVLGFCYAPAFLSTIARPVPPSGAQSADELALQRFKSVIAFAFSGLHLSPTQRMPFNPVLGETFQATLEDNTAVFVEQVSHHPPISRWEVSGPAGDYIFRGQVGWSVSGFGNSMKSQQKGECSIEFTSTGQKVTFDLPYVSIGGLLVGDRTFDFGGTMHFHDHANQLSCDLTFHPDSRSGLWRRLFRSNKTLRDVARGVIVRGREEVCAVDGSWLSHLDIGAERFWELGQQKPSSVFPVADPLPTDSRFREDVQALAEGDLERAEELKTLTEEKQRYLRRVEQASGASPQATSNALYEKAAPLSDSKHGADAKAFSRSNLLLHDLAPGSPSKRKSHVSLNSADDESFYDASETYGDSQQSSRRQSLERSRLDSPSNRSTSKSAVPH